MLNEEREEIRLRQMDKAERGLMMANLKLSRLKRGCVSGDGCYVMNKTDQENELFDVVDYLYLVRFIKQLSESVEEMKNMWRIKKKNEMVEKEVKVSSSSMHRFLIMRLHVTPFKLSYQFESGNKFYVNRLIETFETKLLSFLKYIPGSTSYYCFKEISATEFNGTLLELQNWFKSQYLSGFNVFLSYFGGVFKLNSLKILSGFRRVFRSRNKDDNDNQKRKPRCFSDEGVLKPYEEFVKCRFVFFFYFIYLFIFIFIFFFFIRNGTEILFYLIRGGCELLPNEELTELVHVSFSKKIILTTLRMVCIKVNLRSEISIPLYKVEFQFLLTDLLSKKMIKKSVRIEVNADKKRKKVETFDIGFENENGANAFFNLLIIK
jgi:hypothetical protein